jgi:phosphinothricin acetyltransferase
MSDDDWPAVRQIYAEGIATGDATFETEPPTLERFRATHVPTLTLVAEREGRIVGWAAAGRVSDRCAYEGVAEHSVYVAAGERRTGVGRSVLDALIEASERQGIWTLQSGIFPENTGSLALHTACGFRIVGLRERLGKHNGVWRDVLLLERRTAE